MHLSIHNAPVRTTIVIPAYNEEQCIRSVAEREKEYLGQHHRDADIIIVDDGSTDRTAEVARGIPGVSVISHPMNKGYGAAIKTGMRAAKTEWCITYDADNQHQPESLLPLLEKISEQTDLVIGVRKGYKGPIIRQPGKRLIGLIANYLTETKIPDFNSGLRAFRRTVFLQYEHLFPNGFSLSTTSTICFLKQGHSVAYCPIAIKQRTGKSAVRPRDALKTLMLVIRLTMLFSPLRVFLPASVLCGLLGLALLVQGLYIDRNISDSTVVLILFATILFFFGLLSDQIAAIRREIHVRK